MKQKRKQELQTNELAQTIMQMREFFSRYGNYLFGGVVVLAIVLAVLLYTRRAEATARDNAFQQMRTARFVDDEQNPVPEAELRTAINTLKQVAAEQKDKSLARRALLSLSQGLLMISYIEPDLMTEDLLREAEKASQTLLTDYGDQAIPAAAALLGLATIEANLFVLDGDPGHKDKALNFLTQIRDDPEKFGGTPFMARALEAINQLDKTFQIVTIAEAPPMRPPADDAILLPGDAPSAPVTVRPVTVPTTEAGDAAEPDEEPELDYTPIPDEPEEPEAE
jgi:hypothetical protein